MGKTKIEWTDTTWNPVTGCTPISPGCAHCYARRMAKRLAGRCGYPSSPHEFDVTLHPERLEEPLHWKQPRRAFVCSMSDLFHEDVPTEFIWHVWGVMRECPQHTFQVLTKRPKRMASVLEEMYAAACADPLPNVIGMTTVENQEQADERIPWLLKAPFVTRGVSIEPMLSAVQIRRFLDVFGGVESVGTKHPNLNWVICGGETGPNARPLHPAWARSLRDQCVEAGVPFFFKQWGEFVESSIDDPESFTFPISGTPRAVLSYGHGDVSIKRVGKSKAGCLLDSREWKQFPQ